MSGKKCRECGERFEPSRSSQRFCSTRCANRQRDRRRRQAAAAMGPVPAAAVRRRGFDSKLGQMETHRKASVRPAADLASSRQRQESLRNQLRSQAVDIDRLEAENTEHREVIRNLRSDVARLQSIQQTDAHDLVHLGGKLLALTQATGVELHDSTKALFRRRGWTATKRNPESQSQ
ncbi:hypothetical protein TV39_09045 [Arthrobacter sp. SPG23]|nr:hypothetical protein TV39_09045 [Arthrobacter sp. SPG23]